LGVYQNGGKEQKKEPAFHEKRQNQGKLRIFLKNHGALLNLGPGSLSLQSFLRKNGLPNMKKDIHPDYHEVVFHDTASDFKFLTRSTLTSKEKIKWEDGKEYPLIKVEVSSASHPFFTGKKIFVDTAGRVEKFQKKYQKKKA
jgi:large subunit ribosomal protein L31